MRWNRYGGASPIEWVSHGLPGPSMMHDGVWWGSSGSRVYRSDDSWRTRDLIYTFPGGAVCRNMLSVAPGTFLIGVDNRIERTTDNGVSFSTVLTATSPGSTFGLRSFATAPDGTIYAATYGDKNPSNGELYRSEDNGATWELVFNLVSDLAYPSAGVHIHGVHCDPYTSDVWLNVGDSPNSSILRCQGDPAVLANWEIMSHPVRNPLAFPGYPEYVNHQPIRTWFDETKVFFTNDNEPWAVKAYNKVTKTWYLTLDYADFGAVPDYALGAYGFAFAETDTHLYHPAVPNSSQNLPLLWRMDKATEKWEVFWKGFPPPPSGVHGISYMIPTDKSNEFMVGYYQAHNSENWHGIMRV